MKYGLVFAGGGARGAYQIGVWRALSELGIEISAVTGTSIGAVNGALFVQGEYDAAEKLWRQISIDKVISLPEGMKHGDNLFKFCNIKNIAFEIYKNGGLDMSPFEEMVRGLINERKIRRSPIDFGVSAFSLTEKSEIYKFKDDIPEGQLADYLMASVCLLGFRIKKINMNRFIDGGMYNNMPVNMLIDRDIDNIITVNVKGPGTYKHFNLAGRNVIKIRCRTPRTGMMQFDRDGIERSMDEGYMDCMKAFGRLEGVIYSFKDTDYHNSRKLYSKSVIDGIEHAAEIMEIDPARVYGVEELIRLTLHEYLDYAEKREYCTGEGWFDKIKGIDDKTLLGSLVSLMQNGKNDYIAGKLPVLGANYDAASAILYFLKGKNVAGTCI